MFVCLFVCVVYYKNTRSFEWKTKEIFSKAKKIKIQDKREAETVLTSVRLWGSGSQDRQDRAYFEA